VDPEANEYLSVLGETALPFSLTGWMDDEVTYTTDYTGGENMEIIQNRVNPAVFADSREISQVIQPSATVGTHYNSIGVRVPDGFRLALTAFDFASLRSLNEEINITHTVMTWFNWKMRIGEDLAMTDMRIEPENPKFMERVNITVVARNNGINYKISNIMFYVTGPDGIERQIPTYGSADANPVEARIEGGGQVIKSKEWLATETGLHTFRAMIDPYFVVPEVSETNNDLSYSTSTQTSSLILQAIMVVDDDGGTSSTDMITNSIDAMGYYNDIWDTGTGIPTVDDLKKYNTVIWNTGDGAGNILDASVGGTQDQIEAYLLGNYSEAQYLDKHNETLWLLGNGFISGSSTYAAGNFFHDMFGVGFYDDNAISSSSDLIGKTDHLISHGVEYERTGFGVNDDRINPAATLTMYDTVEEVYFGNSEASANCIGLAHNNSFYFYNTIISTYNLVDIIIPGIVPEKDTQIERPFPPINGYGGSDRMKLGRVTDADLRSVMMEWDLSEIPATATIDTATLKFYTTGMLGATAISRVNVYPIDDIALTGPAPVWVEGEHAGELATDGATWSFFDISLGAGGAFTGNAVMLPAGPGVDSTLKTFTPNLPTSSQAVTIDVQNIVQNWVDGTVENEGLVLTLWSELLLEKSTGENEIYSKEYINSQYWPRMIISYTDGGVSGQSPVGKENAVAEMQYMGLHWLALKESKPDFRSTNIDISVNNANPQLGNSYIISADIMNMGDGDGTCTVRFLDGDTLVKTSTIFLEGGESVTEEAIWVPLYAGSGNPDYFRTLTVSLDPLDKVEEVFETFNNQPSMSSPVYFLFDDFEYDNQPEAELNWDHEATVVNINGESTLDFLENAETNIISEFAGYSFSNTNWVNNYVVSHSVNSSFSIKEPLAVGTINTALDIVLVLDRSGSMRTGGRTTMMIDACNTLVDLMDANDRVAIFGFDSSVDALMPFTSCDTAGKTALHTYINGLSLLPSGSTAMYRCMARDSLTAGAFDLNGPWGVEDGGEDDGAIVYMQDEARQISTKNIICLSDGGSWDGSYFRTARDMIWSASGEVANKATGEWRWDPRQGSGSDMLFYPYMYTGQGFNAFTAHPEVRNIDNGSIPMNLRVYSIGLGIGHDPDSSGNPMPEVPTYDTYTTSNSPPYCHEKKMWWVSEASAVGGAWTDSNFNNYVDDDEMEGYGYFYAPTANELEDIFMQIAGAMAGAGTTRGGASGGDASRASRATTTLHADFARSVSSTSSGGTYTAGGFLTTSEDMYVGRFTTGPVYRRSACRWDISSIDDSARIDDVDLEFWVANALENPSTHDIWQFDQDPATLYTGDPSGYWTNCEDDGDDNQYVSGSTAFRSTGWQMFSSLPATAAADLQAQLTSDWFAVGMLEAGDNTGDDCFVWGNGHGTSDARLIVTYTDDDIYEENDALGSAYDLGALSGTSVFDCMMFDTNDYYMIPSVSIGTKIVVNLDFIHASGDIDLQLIAPDGTTVVTSSITATDDEGISRVAAYSGNYHIRVFPKAGSFKSPYSMTVMVEGGSGSPPTYLNLEFWTREYGDEQTTLPGTFIDHFNGDGIAVSTDGVNWNRLWNYPSSVGAWTEYGPLDIGSVIDVTGHVYIKFQQYDQLSFEGDGIVWDDISLSTDGGVLGFGATYTEDFEAAVGTEWSTYESGANGRNQRTSTYFHNGAWSWGMDVNPTGTYVLNELVLHLQMTNSGGGATTQLRYPRNPYPSLGSTDVPLHPILIWTGGDVGIVDHYGIWMGNEEGMEQRIEDPDTGNPLKVYGESFDPGLLAPLGTYFWYVVAYDGDDELTADSRDSRDYETGSPPAPVGSWSFSVESGGDPSMGRPAVDELNDLDTKAFRLTDSVASKLTFFHKFNIEPTINGAYLQLGVKYQGGATAVDIENADNYRYYYIVPEETYNSNLYLGTDSFARPFLACEGSDFHTEAAVNYGKDYNGDGDNIDAEENLVMWCWNGKSSGGLFDWQYCSVDMVEQIGLINAESSAGIDIDNDYFKIRFCYFYFGAGGGGGWWVDDVKVTSSTGGTPTITSQDVWTFVKDGTKANSGTGCWWNGNPTDDKLLHSGIDNSLITKPIDLTRAVEADFNAYFAYNINNDPGLPPDCLRIEVSNDGGNIWKAINYGVRSFSGVSNAGVNPSASYKAASTEARVNVDMSAWGGEVVLMRFRIVTTSAASYEHNEDNTLNWGGLYLDDVTISGTSITETRSPATIIRRTVRDGQGDGDNAQEVTVCPSVCLNLDDALASARQRLAAEHRDGNTQFGLPVPVGTGFRLFELDEDSHDNDDQIGPSQGEEAIYEFLTVVFATKREAEPIKLY
jgi:hypothetical protein